MKKNIYKIYIYGFIIIFFNIFQPERSAIPKITQYSFKSFNQRSHAEHRIFLMLYVVIHMHMIFVSLVSSLAKVLGKCFYNEVQNRR